MTGNSSPIFLHIGANKTGSTTLQRNLFAGSSGLVYLGEDCDGYEDYRELLNSMVSDDDLYFQKEPTAALFGKYMNARGDKPFIYSNEDIMTSRVPAQCAARLHELMPGARIMVVIRNQLTAIPSMYANHGAFLKMVPRSYWRRYVSFDDWMKYMTSFIKYSYLDSYFYDRILSLYAGHFGQENIHILFYEDFARNPPGFISEFCRILGIDAQEAIRLVEGKRERKRNTMRQLRYHRFRSQFFWGVPLSRYLPWGRQISKAWQGFLAAGTPADGFMSEYWKNKIIELYCDDNAKLARSYNLPLREYGYPIA